MLEVQNISKSYQDFQALKGINLKVPAQSVFGLLGSNGAGKTTLIRLINQIIDQDEGNIFLDGQKVNTKIVQKIGYMPEDRGLYPKMKVGDQLLFLARIKGMSKDAAKVQAKDWLRRLDIEGWWDKKVDQLSKGMQQKIQFISTVINNPKLLILDEPFTGLDPVNTELLKKEILKLNSEGCTIIFSTHRMEQVEALCSDIVIINDGEIKLEGDVEGLKHKFKKNHFKLNLEKEIDVSAWPFECLKQSSGSYIFKLSKPNEINDILKHALALGCGIQHFEEILPSLNDIFIEVV